MKTMRMNLLLVVILILTMVVILTVGGVEKANADVRVRGTVHTPVVRVHVESGPNHGYEYRENRRRPLPVTVHRCEHRITRQDKKIAKRLARYTGVSKRELLSLCRQGYHWMEIGIWLELPRSVVHAAYRGESWDRFLNRGRRHACRPVVVYPENGRIWNSDRYEGRYAERYDNRYEDRYRRDNHPKDDRCPR